MKKSISVSNLTLDLYLDYVKPAAIAAGILEEVPARDDWHEYTALHTDAAAADEIAHCMYCACMCAGNDGIERTHEEYIRHEAERMIGQLEVSIKYDLHNVADTLTALLVAMTEALHPTTPAEAAQAATEAPEQPTTDEQEEEDKTMSNTAFTPAEAAMHAATVRGIIRRQGGYRERDLLTRPHEITRGETWNEEHKIINVLETTPDPDGYRAGCAVDIVTRTIVG